MKSSKKPELKDEYKLVYDNRIAQLKKELSLRSERKTDRILGKNNSSSSIETISGGNRNRIAGSSKAVSPSTWTSFTF